MHGKDLLVEMILQAQSLVTTAAARSHCCGNLWDSFVCRCQGSSFAELRQQLQVRMTVHVQVPIACWHSYMCLSHYCCCCCCCCCCCFCNEPPGQETLHDKPCIQGGRLGLRQANAAISTQNELFIRARAESLLVWLRLMSSILLALFSEPSEDEHQFSCDSGASFVLGIS